MYTAFEVAKVVAFNCVC